MRRAVLVIASLLVSLFFLWLVLRDIPLEEIGERFQQADIFWLVIALMLVTLGLWARAVRWRGLLDFRISHRDSFHITNITFLLNQLPLRAGEIARSVLATRSGIPVMTAATSIIVERLIDSLTVVLFLAVAFAQLPDAPPEVTQTATLFGIAALLSFALLVFFARFPQLARQLLALILRLIPVLERLPLEKLLEQVLDGLQPLTKLRNLVHVALWTVVGWGFSLATLATLAQALNVQAVDLILLSLIGISLASLSIALPLSIASIGPFEAAIAVAGQLTGLDNITSVSLGFLFHGMSVLGYAVWGIIGILALGISLSDMLKQQPEK